MPLGKPLPVVALALACAIGTSTAQDAPAQDAPTQDAPAQAATADTAAAATDKDAQIRALQERVEKLEARLAELEKRTGTVLAQATATETRETLRAKAQARMRQDLDKRSKDGVRQAEQLYQVANKNWRSPEAKASLEQMVEKFPDLNRTGCAILYLGQMSEGEERVKLLRAAIDKHGDCFYGNGVQVGAFARFLLGHHYKEAADAAKAEALFDEVRTDFPGAIDHRGRPLADQIPAE